MKVNKHIEDYLDYYCDFSRDIPFAVLLKGKWGCGKTYFIKDYVGARKNIKILHISLYGVDSFNGIKEKIIIELLPFIPKKYNKFADSIVGLVKKIPKIKDWVPTNLDDLLIDIFLKKNSKCIFVFDDIERCNIEIDKLLGQINNFVEFKSQKVILIANEEEILEKDKYNKIKEKLIGKEFSIDSSKEDAINFFINGLQDKKLISYSQKLNKLLLRIFTQSTYDNLRLIGQALSSFEYFFNNLPDKIKNEIDLAEKMFYEFVVIYVEYKRGNIKNDQFSDKYPNFFKGTMDYKDSAHFLDKYDDGISNWIICFDISILGKILQGIVLSEDEEKIMIKQLEQLTGISTESWQKLWHRNDYSDEDFFNNLEDVQQRWQKREYSDFYKVIHIFGIFLELSEIGLLHKDKASILDDGKKYIEFLIETSKFPLDLKEQNSDLGWKNGTYGLGYHGMGYTEWKEIMIFIDNKSEELKATHIKQKINNELMPILRGEREGDQPLSLLINYNFIQYAGSQESYFQYFDVEEVVKIIVERDASFLHALQEIFKERYGEMAAKTKDIKMEVPFLTDLKIKLEDEIKKIETKFGNKKTPKSLTIQNLIKEAIQPFIEKNYDSSIRTTS